MKKIFILIFSLFGTFCFGQDYQNVSYKFSAFSNKIEDIDSIRFSNTSTEMEVVLKSGNFQSHNISGITKVYFGSGTATCGATEIHNPLKNYGTVTDQDGNSYKTIKIGTQEWMAENLRTTKYTDGKPIQHITDSAAWFDAKIGGWCHYANNTDYECPYGKLYNWYAVSSGVCPAGWHMPTDNEWSVLINFLDPAAKGGDVIPNVAGGDLKSIGLKYWATPNGNASNTTGFSAVPAGSRSNLFNDINGIAYYWTSTENSFNKNNAWLRYVTNGWGSITRNNNVKYLGLSVRCVKD